jgi:hypothetical protein
MNTNEMDDQIPELGDLITIISNVHGRTTGRIIFRDMKLIRVKPYQASDRAIEFPLDESGMFSDAIGVTELIIHSKRRSPYFSKQLAVLPGTVLEFYTSDSKVAAQKGVIKSIVAKNEVDQIELEDGRVLDFNFVGPPEPISVILPRAPDVTPENESGQSNELANVVDEEEEPDFGGEEEAKISDEVIDSLDELLLPASDIEVISSSDMRYNDDVQFNAMFTDLISGLDIKMSKNKKVLRSFQNQAKAFLDLKNEIYREEGDFVYYTPETLLQSIKQQVKNTPIDSVIPITRMRRGIFIDGESFETQHIVAKNELNVFAKSLDAFQSYNSTSSAGGASNKYVTYMNAIFNQNRGLNNPAGELGKNSGPVLVEQTVLRTPVFPTQMKGLVSNLPAGRKVSTFGGAQKSSTTTIDVNFIGNIKHQTYRVLPAINITDPSTGYKVQIAQPDVLDTVGYLHLTPELSKYRSASTRSNVLIYDIQKSEDLRNSKPFIHHLYENMGDVTIIHDEDDDIKLTELFEDYIPNNILSYSDESLRYVIEMLGLQKLELTPTLMNIMNEKINKGIAHFDGELSKANQLGMEAVTKTANPTITPAIINSESLTNAVESVPELKTISENMKNVESTLNGNDLVLVSHIEKIGSENGRSLLYAALAAQERPNVFKQVEKKSESEESGDTEGAEGSEGAEGAREKKESESKPSDLPAEPSGLVERLTDELNREVRRQAIQEEHNKIVIVSEEPIINTCEHVDKLNMIYAIESEAERMYLLERFIEKYQYGISNNWITCNICKLNLVCRHEILMIEEFKNELGHDVLHKALLLQYGEKGNFGSDYICKNCGQKISEVEYDTHIEFDDEGKPLIGQTVVVEGEEGILANTADFISDLLTYGKERLDMGVLKPAEKQIYIIAQTLFENAGCSPSGELYMRVVKNIYEYILANENNEYAKLAGNYLKLKKTPPKREVFTPTFLLSVVAAFVIVEFQTSENETVVNIPSSDCTFSRDGYPRDGDDSKSVSNGLVDYIVCILANVKNEDTPWTDTLWSVETIGSQKRIALTKYYVLSVIKNLKNLPTIGDALMKAKNEYEKRLVAGQLVGVSKDDRLPPAFRPATQLVGASEGVEAVPAFTNLEMFKKSVLTDSVEKIRPLVERRELILAQQVIEEMHSNALKSAMERPGQSKRMDGHCCEITFEEAKKNGIGVQAIDSSNVTNEIDIVRSALKAINIRDPVLSSAGTHFIVPWSAKPLKQMLVEADSSVFFRLFFKACASGSNLGHPHEYGPDNICRRCNLYLPTDIVFKQEQEQRILYTIATTSDGKTRERYEQGHAKLIEERNVLYQKSLADIGIVVTPESFSDLQDAIRNVKHILPPNKISILHPTKGFEMLTELIKDSNALYPTYVDDWKELTHFIENDIMLKEDAREIKFGNFVSKYDILQNAIISQYISLGENVKNQAAMMREQGNINKLLLTLDKIVQTTKEIRNRAPRLLLTMFVAPTRQVASGMKVEVNAAYWFPTLTPHHKETLDTAWKKHYNVIDMILKRIEDDDEVTKVVKNAFARIADFFGPVLQVFNSEIRGDQLLTHQEVGFVIGWFLRSILLSGLSESSSLYAGSPSVDVTVQAVKIFRLYITNLFEYISKKLNLFDMTPEMITMYIEADKEHERNYFITRQETMSKQESDIDKIFKSLGIGPYAEGALKNNTKYDADYMEFHRIQRSEFKVPEFTDDVSGKKSAAKEDYGLGFGGDSSAYGVGESGGHYDGSQDE